jgi:hypothetical protein
MLASFPLPVNATSWQRVPPNTPAAVDRLKQTQYQPPLQNPTRQTVAGDVLERKEYKRRGSEPVPMLKPVAARKNTLTYDPDMPDQPPRFRSWWEENGGVVEKGSGERKRVESVRLEIGDVGGGGGEKGRGLVGRKSTNGTAF